MSAEMLRRAAASERAEWGNPVDALIYPRASAVHLELACWLEDDAAQLEFGSPDEPGSVERSITLARLLLGEAP
ncbi:hypothetical protein [Oerskovia rustica]|uniref:Uncharacterized protein n=1 Tax=Oerskovia rustica TaxID=2762237 RepID=A0ABR8RPC6_9CELL|nr:hypothetical protein [Oerskovia rustica]MBD7949621.1 hypothetical protein [Oerskovia rustica]